MIPTIGVMGVIDVTSSSRALKIVSHVDGHVKETELAEQQREQPRCLFGVSRHQWKDRADGSTI